MTEKSEVSRRNLLISGGLVTTASLLGAARPAALCGLRAEPIIDPPGHP